MLGGRWFDFVIKCYPMDSMYNVCEQTFNVCNIFKKGPYIIIVNQLNYFYAL